jgi:integrase
MVVNFYLKNPKAINETLIYLFFSFDNQRLKYSTGESVKPTYWNAEKQVVKNLGDEASDINDRLDKLRANVKKVYRELCNAEESINPEVIRQKLIELSKFKKPKVDLFLFIENHIKAVKSVKKAGTITSYNNTFNRLKEYKEFVRKKIDFNNINLEFYYDFVDYLTKQRTFSKNTIGKHIKNIKVFLNEATEQGLNKNMDYKSKRFKKLTEESDSIYLTEKEIDKFSKLNVRYNKVLEQTRDLFVIACYSGLRFSDFSQLRLENFNNGIIKIRTQKPDEVVAIPIHDKVKAILKKYNNTLPKAASSQQMNIYLKDLGQSAKFFDTVETSITKGGMKVKTFHKKYELITTHTARRSFATNLFLAGFPAISIMKITGHNSEKAFLKYIKISPEQNAELLNKFWKNQTLLKVV